MVKPKKIINNPDNAVEDFIDGLLLQYPHHLRRLQEQQVVLAAERTPAQVQLISGGGSGHEPSHAGWIGQGMLSAAVCGGIFASPSVAAVLAGIQAVARHTIPTSAAAAAAAPGVLVVIKNYTGDRLNFGVAAERAATVYGIPVRTIVVADDTALPRQKGVTGARGVAGTVLVHKIAGAAAAAGKSLDECAALAQQVCSRMGTLGIALDSVTVPGAVLVNDRLDASTIEIGLGIHGEAGLKQSPLLTADDMAKEMCSTIQAYGRDSGDGSIIPFTQPGDDVVLLVNNLGGTSNFEMSILTKACVQLMESQAYGVRVSRVLVGSYMTSFDMHGASLTIFNTTGAPELLTYLDAFTTAPAWSKCDVWQPSVAVRPSMERLPDPATDAITALAQPPCGAALVMFPTTAPSILTATLQALAEAEPLLTKYDTIVGDGDCGTTMKRGATYILDQLQQGKLPTEHPVPFFVGLARAVSASMGGTSGILLELMMDKIASTLAREKEITVASLATALSAGVDAVKLYGGATTGSRTMLDALIPAAQVLQATTSLSQAAQAARQGADATAQMETASAGRSNYLSADSLAGTPDPGAVATAIVLEAIAKAV
jgi:dihydroxyacetone kinase